jgi:membrane-bound serine protease (ClpP class)
MKVFLRTTILGGYLALLFMPAKAAGSTYAVLEFDGAIGPVAERYIANGIDRAVGEGVSFILLELDTPGGLDESMRAIVKKILASPVPVIGYVYPQGARAASAGVFIMLACNVTAMAPGTNMGAAHPVNMGGQQPDSVMMGKIENDAVAFVRSIAEKRGRDADWAENSVRKSVSVSAEEAKRLKLVDYIASSPEELVKALDGRVVETSRGKVTLETAGVREVKVGMRWFEKLLGVLSNPNLVYILMMIGIYGLIAWVQNPGSIFPGVIGFIALVFALYGLQVLPVNYAGLALIGLAIFLFILEVKVTSHGMLAVGGIVSLILGTVIMFQSVPQAFGISWPVIIIVIAIVVALLALIVYLAARAHTRRPTTGFQGMIGWKGEASSDLTVSSEGQVYVHGEYWTAVPSDPSLKIKKGEHVKVVAMDGMVLKVEKLQ